jgi:serine/threonine protein kinase
VVTERLDTFPEKLREPYTEFVDVWSLGVVILELGHGVSDSVGQSARAETPPLLEDHMNTCNAGKPSILDKMIVLDPKDRASVKECLEIMHEEKHPLGTLYP